MGQDSDQASITDFAGRKDTDTGNTETSKQNQETTPDPPSADDPIKLLHWLQDDSTPSPATVTDKLPKLINTCQTEGTGAWGAGRCINEILQAVSSPIDCQELVMVLDNSHVETMLVVDHLLAIYPRDLPTLDYNTDFAFIENTDELSHADRMRVYQMLSRLPPDNEIYETLRGVDDLFDGVVAIGGDRYDLHGFFQTYAMRCLQARLRYPETAPEFLAERAISDFPLAALRLVVGQPSQAVTAGLITSLIEALDDTDLPADFYHGTIVPSLYEFYTDATEEDRRKIGDLIESVLSLNIYPTEWQAIVETLVTDIRTGPTPLLSGALFSHLLERLADAEISREDIKTTCSIAGLVAAVETEDDIRPWLPPLQTIGECWPQLLVEHLESLGAVAQQSDNQLKQSLLSILEAVAKSYPESVYSLLEPLVQDLQHVSSAAELEALGNVLRTLQVYPPPPQLRTLYDSTDPEIEAEAKSITADLRRQFASSTPEITPTDVDNLQQLSDEYTLVRRTGPLSWEPASFTHIDETVITEVARLARAVNESDGQLSEVEVEQMIQRLGGQSYCCSDQETNSVQVVTPSYDPGWGVLIIVGAMLAQIVEPSLEIVVYSPGTNGWGTKKDIRTALREFGVTATDGSTVCVTPLLDLVPTARVTDSELTVETSRTTVVDDPPYLTVVRNRKSLQDATADLVIHNYMPGITGSDASQVQQSGATVSEAEVTEKQPSETQSEKTRFADRASIDHLVRSSDIDSNDLSVTDTVACLMNIEVYSLFCIQEAAGRHQHIGPPTDLATPVVISDDESKHDIDCSTRNDGVVGHGTRDRCNAAQSLGVDDSQVELHAVNSESSIPDLLSKLDQYIRAVDSDQAQQALRSLKYTIESLPVSVTLHDQWIQDQISEGNRLVPRRLQHRQNGIQNLMDETVFDTEILDDALTTIDTILDRLNDSNPLFIELLNVLDQAAPDNQVGILCSKKSYKEMLDIDLREQAGEWAVGDDVLLLDDATVRDVAYDEIDWLITFGVLSPQRAIYYHHPAVDKTIVIGHAVNDLADRLKGIEHRRRPFLPRNTDVELPELQLETCGSDIDPPEEQPELTDELYRTYLSVAAGSQQKTSGRSGGGGTTTRYRVEFEETDAVTIRDTHPVIVRSEEHLVSAGEYVLRSISRVSQGDELVVIKQEQLGKLWESFLRQDWEQATAIGGETQPDPDEAFMDVIRLWYDAVERGVQAHIEPKDDLSEGIGDFARELKDEVSVGTDAIEDWARAVVRADTPSDLVFRKQLRMSPQQKDGIRAVAMAYGNERMADNWEQVFTRIKTVRTTLRQRGQVFWQWLADRACEGELFNEPSVGRFTVTRCEQVD